MAQKKSKTTTVWTGRGEGISSSPCAARRRPVISHHHRHQATITKTRYQPPIRSRSWRGTEPIDRGASETPGQVGRCTTYERDHRSAARAGDRHVFGHAWPVSVGPSSPSSSRQRRSRWQTYLSGATATPTRSARRSEQKAGKPAALATLLRGHTQRRMHRGAGGLQPPLKQIITLKLL